MWSWFQRFRGTGKPRHSTCLPDPRSARSKRRQKRQLFFLLTPILYLSIDDINNMPVCVTVLYPGDAKFDLKYYLDHHMPLVGRLFGCVEIRLDAMLRI